MMKETLKKKWNFRRKLIIFHLEYFFFYNNTSISENNSFVHHIEIDIIMYREED